MNQLINKSISSLKSEGITKTSKRIALYPIRRLMRTINVRNIRKNALAPIDAEDKFTKIYEKNYWGSEESISGPGSTLEHTKNLRSKLPELFDQFSIKTIFDAPCGDFHWMKYVVKENNVSYIGADIVNPLIEFNKSKFEDDRTKFIHMDLTKDQFPSADMMICRDCLFHLSFEDTRKLLRNFVDSNISYLLTTTYVNTDNLVNADISTGEFRLIDLFAAPYQFPKDVCYRIEDWNVPSRKGVICRREMCLWTRDQIIDAMRSFN